MELLLFLLMMFFFVKRVVGNVCEVEIFVCRQSKELFFFQSLYRSKATSICVVLGHGILEFLDLSMTIQSRVLRVES